jgi:hypothetical protein
MSALPPKADIARRRSVGRPLSVKICSVRLAAPLISDVNLFGNCERIIYFNAEVARRALDFRVTKKELDGSQIAGAAID